MKLVLNYMKQYLIFSLMIILLILGISEVAHANNDETAAYQKEPLSFKPLSNKILGKDVEVFDFVKKEEPQKIKKEIPSPTTGKGQLPPAPVIESDGNSLRNFLVLLAGVLLVFVVFKLVAGETPLVNRPMQHNAPVSLVEVETNLHNADVEGVLKQALTKKDYRLAIRMYYLAIIKELSLKKAIEWTKDKTNGQYMTEMRRKEHPKLKEFRDATRVFEYVWYSDVVFDDKKYEETRLSFKDLLAAIKQ